MKARTMVLLGGALSVTALCTAAAVAEWDPSEPIRFVVYGLVLVAAVIGGYMMLRDQP